MALQTKCLAVDDHPAVRQGLALLLEGADDIDLVESVDCGEAALDAIEKHQPDVVIVDVRLPGMDGISAVKRIAERAPGVNTVVFSAYGDKRLLSDAIAAGARGYVMKGSPPEDLIRAIRTVDGGRYSIRALRSAMATACTRPSASSLVIARLVSDFTVSADRPIRPATSSV